MKLLIVFILFFSVAVNAEHHREHALAHLDAADYRLFVVRINLIALKDVVSEEDSLMIQNSLLYSNVVETRINDARALLANGGDLKTVRRLLNQPGNGVPKSAVTNAYAMNSHAIILSKTVDHAWLIAAHNSIVAMWKSIDLAVWHTNDAIREEIYQDPAFICSGPNNHCQ